MTWEILQSLVPSGPAESLQPSRYVELFPALEHAKSTPQSPVYHQEGDVFTHTLMVLEELVRLPDYLSGTKEEKAILFLAALLHDVAKYSTTVIDPVTGAIGQPGHSRKGAIDARIALWDMGVPFTIREEICRLINVHQVPFYVLDGSRRNKSPEFQVRELSWSMNLKLLATLAEADMRGRICADMQKILDNIELFRELAKEDNCYEYPKVFADPHTAVSYFRGADIHPDYSLYKESGSNVIVMSGLPASGKNTWVSKHHKDLPVISFDDARDELGLKHGKNEGMVAHYAIDKAKDLLRKKAPFVWNSTNLSELMRKKTLDLLFSYHAHVDLVYLEKPRSELLRRNTKRDTSLDNKTLQGMLFNWDLPLPTEAHSVRYLVDG